MNRVLMSRGMGKTSQLLKYAISLAEQNPEEEIFYICHNPINIWDATDEEERGPLPKNFRFVSFAWFTPDHMRGRKCKVVLDELDDWLRQFNIIGYTNTI